MRPTLFGLYWLGWFAAFLIPEIYWIIVNARNTLSDNWWAVEGIDTHHPFDFATWTPAHYVIGVVLLVFVVWLFLHLIFGLFG